MLDHLDRLDRIALAAAATMLAGGLGIVAWGAVTVATPPSAAMAHTEGDYVIFHDTVIRSTVPPAHTNPPMHYDGAFTTHEDRVFAPTHTSPPMHTNPPMHYGRPR